VPRQQKNNGPFAEDEEAATKPRKVFPVTQTSYPASAGTVNPPRLYPHGQPLPERAGAATIFGENAYAFEFTAATGEDVYGCYKSFLGEAGEMEFCQEYTLHTASGTVTECNCPDHTHRPRVCKHMVELAVVLGTGLRTRKGVFVAAVSTTVISRPRTVADALRAMREDYHAAAARAVILTAADVEEAERAEAARSAAARPIVSGFDPSDWK